MSHQRSSTPTPCHRQAAGRLLTLACQVRRQKLTSRRFLHEKQRCCPRWTSSAQILGGLIARKPSPMIYVSVCVRDNKPKQGSMSAQQRGEIQRLYCLRQTKVRGQPRGRRQRLAGFSPRRWTENKRFQFREGVIIGKGEKKRVNKRGDLCLGAI